MCQLTLIYSIEKDITRELSINAAVINPLKAKMDYHLGHVDGFGFFINRKVLWKTKTAGIYINFSGTNYKPEPIIQHVRKVSHGKITDENAHPFEFDYFVAAHNGTLKGGFIKDDKDGKTDSEQFFSYVNNLIKKDNSLTVLEAFKKAYDEIDGGKFAFLVYDKRLDKFFVIRGNATLYVSYISKGKEIIGVIVNTEENSLEMNLMLLSAKFGVDYTKPKLLDNDTIYYLDEEKISLEKVEGISIKYKDRIKVKTVYDGKYYHVRNRPKITEGKDIYSSLNLFSNADYTFTTREIYAMMVYYLINNGIRGMNEIIEDVSELNITDKFLNYAAPIILGGEKRVKSILEKSDK